MTDNPAAPGCAECATALADPLHGIYLATCPGCQTRMLAHSQPAWTALHAPERDPAPLQAALVCAFGAAAYPDARRRLWAWVRLRSSSPPASAG